jgi:hypothetical protein
MEPGGDSTRSQSVRGADRVEHLLQRARRRDGGEVLLAGVVQRERFPVVVEDLIDQIALARGPQLVRTLHCYRHRVVELELLAPAGHHFNRTTRVRAELFLAGEIGGRRLQLLCLRVDSCGLGESGSWRRGGREERERRDQPRRTPALFDRQHDFLLVSR